MNIRTKYLKNAKLGAILTLCLTFICCLCVAFTGLFGFNNKSAEAKGHGNYIDLDTENNGISLKGIGQLINLLGGNETLTYQELSDYLAVSLSTQQYSNTRVQLGGLEWNVVMTSKINKDSYTGGGARDDIIVTLWLSDAIQTDGQNAVQWNKWSEKTTNHAYPSSMYSSSYIRSQLVGSSYAATAGATTLTAGAAAPVWSDFIAKYGSYIETPASTTRQETQNSTNIGYSAYYSPNECWGDPLGNNTWYTSGSDVNMDFTSKSGYTDWKNDKLWIPSLRETGMTENSVGLWVTSKHSRSTSTGESTWLRSSGVGVYGTGASSVLALQAGGDYYDGTVRVTEEMAVRPAFHLNLKKAWQAAETQTIDLGDNGNFNKDGLSELYTAIGGQGVSSYADLSRTIGYLGSVDATSIGTKVVLNGLEWNVVYGSKTKDGRVIATLWLDDVCFTDGQNAVQWNKWSANNTSYSYPSNMYSSSYIRSQLMGTSYAATMGATTLTAGTAAPVWKDLRDKYGAYMVAPANVAWQQDGLSSVTLLGGANLNPNDAYGTPAEGTWYNKDGVNMNFTSKVGYTSWQNDILWMPASTETGTTTAISGFWNLPGSMRKSNLSSWLRSGRNYRADHVYFLKQNGSLDVDNETLLVATNSYAVRPAFHLDLAAASNEVNLSTDDNNIGDIYNDTKGAPNASTLTAFYSAVMENGSTYSALNQYLRSNGELSSEDIRKNNDGANIMLNLGGMEWDVTYLSKTRSGDIIATLWLEDIPAGQEKVSFNNSANASTSYSFPSNMYSTSMARAYINGTSYPENYDSTTLTDGSSLQQEIWKTLIEKYSQYMVAPINVEWQENQSAQDILSWMFNLPNEAYGTPSGGYFYSNNTVNMDYSFKQGYNDWANDLLWLPSFSETGTGTEGGIWKTNLEQRSFNGQKNDYIYVRSGRGWSANGPHLLGHTGSINVTSSTSKYYLRPAMHLNITKLAKEAKDSYFTNDNSAIINEWNAAVQQSLTNRGSAVTVKLTRDWLAMPDETFTTSFGTGVGFYNGSICVPKGANIILDLNGYRIDRNLLNVENGLPDGRCITVFGDFTLNDSFGGGAITGGHAARDYVDGTDPYSRHGGGVFAGSGAKFIMNGGTVANTKAWNAGIYTYGAKFIMNGGVIANNQSYQNGSALFVTDKSYCEINGGEMSFNNALDSTAVIAYRNSTMIMNGGVVEYNTSQSDTGMGGGLRADGSLFIMNGGELSYNICKTGGGFSAINKGSIIMNGGTVYHNISRGSGGGISLNSGCSFKMSDGIVKNNSAGNYGGGIYSGAAITLSGGEIIGNTAKQRGGGVSMDGGSIVIDGGKISGNKAYIAGGIEGRAATVTMNGGVISENTCELDVGGLFVHDGGSVFTMNGGAIRNNVSHGTGGGFAVTNGTFNMNGGIITGNISGNAYGGGGHLAGTSQMNLTGGVIIDNFYDKLDTTSGNRVKEHNDVYVGDTANDAKIVIKKVLSSSTRIGVISRSGYIVTKGYAAYGHTFANAGKYFTCNYGSFVDASGELKVNGTSSNSVGRRISWQYNDGGQTIPFGDASYISVVHEEGKSYTISNANSTPFAIADETGRPVTALNKVGKYYINATSSGVADNPAVVFEILPENISIAEISVGNVIYDGTAQIPKVTVTLNGVILEEGKDYTVSASNNVNAGTAKIYVNGIGNYTGLATAEFEIEQRNLNVRWGDLAVEFNGETRGVTVLPEGLVGNDVVEVILTYTDGDDNYVAAPVNAGIYNVYVTLAGNHNYRLASGIGVITVETFTIVPRTVEAQLEKSESVYDGNAHTVTVYFTDMAGNRQQLVYTISSANLVDGNIVNPGAYTLEISEYSSDRNYRVSSATRTLTYTVNRAEAEWSWDENSLNVVYSGSANVPVLNVTGADGTTEYEFYVGEQKVAEAINAGKYTVHAKLNSSNYVLKGSENGYITAEFTVNKADLTVNLAPSLVYNGEAQNPVTDTLDSNFKAEYAAVTGGTTREYSSNAPVNAGNYILKITDTEGNYNVYEGTFTIERASVTAVWSADPSAIFADGSFVWLYDGKQHAPEATVHGLNRAELEVTVTGGQTNNTGSGTATARALISDDNYTLSNATQTFKILQSRVNAIKWFESDGKEVEGNPSYQYISVYGKDGPGLVAYGVLEARTASAWTGSSELLILLDVTYSTSDGKIPSSGYWDYSTEGVSYTATASLKSSDKANTNCAFLNGITGEALQLDFTVTDLVIVNDTVTVYWVIENEDGTHTVLNGATPVAAVFTYNGEAQAPMAIIPGDGYDPAAPQASKYTVLNVGGARTDAGKYSAFITSTEYNVAKEDGAFAYTITPVVLDSIEWTGNSADGKFEWEYNGTMQGPSAQGVAGGKSWNLGVSGAINAGTYTATAYADKKFTFAAGCEVTHQYTIKKLNINDYVTWSANGGTIKTDGDGTYYEYTLSASNPTAKYGPSASFSLTVNGAVVSGDMNVLGKASREGSYRAYAFVPSDFEFANFAVSEVFAEFRIVRSELPEVHWALGMDGDDIGAEETGNIVYVYNGSVFCPVAYFINDDGEKVRLTVYGSGTNAGEYEAVINDSVNSFANGTVKKFTVQPRAVSVALDESATYTYNGEIIIPKITFTPADGLALALGENDYVVSGATDSGTHSATVKLTNGNYVIDGADTVTFVIEKQEIVITWGTDTSWSYDGKQHVPAVTRATINGATITLADYGISVIGAESGVGVYTARVVIGNSNYSVTNSEKEFSIVKFEITVNWEGNADRDGEFEWSYDGVNAFKPSASFTDWNGDTQSLLVVGGAVDAGTYTATAIAPENCTFKFTSGEHAGTHTFNVVQSEITEIEWVVEGYVSLEDGVYTFDYSGNIPSVKAYAVRSDGENKTRVSELSITGVGSEAGEYTAVAAPANSANSAFAPDIVPEIKVVIKPLEVTVEWEADDDTLPVGLTYTWEYDGKAHTLTATFTGVNGEVFNVPVSGGKVTAVSGDAYIARAEDVFNNYDFDSFRYIRINSAELTVTWTGGTLNDDGAYEFEYNGKAQMPVGTADAEVNFAYTVTDGEGKPVNAIINAGTYNVTAKLIRNNNYTLVADSATVKVVVVPKKVSVQWGKTTLEYTGSAIAPVAWYTDTNKQSVALTVTGATTDVGEDYTAVATITDKNYVFTDGTTTASVTFSIEKTTTDEFEWNFEDNKWQATVPPQTGGDGDEQPEVTE